MQGLQGTKIALLIDFDNVILGVEDPGFDVELVVNTLRSRGVVVMGRAYGDWYRHHRHRRKLMEQGIELVETPVFGPLIKNSADIRIVIDGLDIAAAHAHIDTFCLVSGDSDFLPLIKRLQLLGKHVIVIAGVKFTSDLVRRNCNEYLAYENLLAESVGATEDASTLEGSFHLLERAINTLNERGMDSRSSTVKQMMLQLNPAFSERTFGCYQFKQFLDKAARAGIAQVAERVGNAGEHDVLLPEKNGREMSKTVTSSTGNGAGGAVARDAGGSSTNGTSTSGNGSNGSAQNGRNERREPFSRGGRDRNRAQKLDDQTSPRVDAKESLASVETELQLTESPSGSPVAPISASALTSRPGLRRGRLRFSAKAGGAAVAHEAATVGTSSVQSDSVTSEDESSTRLMDAAPVEQTLDVIQTPQEALPEESVLQAAVDNASGEAEEVGETDAATPAKRRGSRGGRRRRGAKNGEAMTSEEDVTNSSETAVSEDSENVVKTSAPTKTTRKVAPSASLEEVASIASKEVESANDVPQTPNIAADNVDVAEAVAPKKRTSRGRRGGTKKVAAEATSETSDDNTTETINE